MRKEVFSQRPLRCDHLAMVIAVKICLAVQSLVTVKGRQHNRMPIVFDRCLSSKDASFGD